MIPDRRLAKLQTIAENSSFDARSIAGRPRTRTRQRRKLAQNCHAAGLCRRIRGEYRRVGLPSPTAASRLIEFGMVRSGWEARPLQMRSKAHAADFATHSGECRRSGFPARPQLPRLIDFGMVRSGWEARPTNGGSKARGLPFRLHTDLDCGGFDAASFFKCADARCGRRRAAAVQNGRFRQKLSILPRGSGFINFTLENERIIGGVAKKKTHLPQTAVDSF